VESCQLFRKICTNDEHIILYIPPVALTWCRQTTRGNQVSANDYNYIGCKTGGIIKIFYIFNILLLRTAFNSKFK